MAWERGCIAMGTRLHCHDTFPTCQRLNVQMGVVLCWVRMQATDILPILWICIQKVWLGRKDGDILWEHGSKIKHPTWTIGIEPRILRCVLEFIGRQAKPKQLDTIPVHILDV